MRCFKKESCYNHKSHEFCQSDYNDAVEKLKKEQLLDQLIDRDWDKAESTYYSMDEDLREEFKSELDTDDITDKKSLVFLWEVEKEF